MPQRRRQVVADALENAPRRPGDSADEETSVAPGRRGIPLGGRDLAIAIGMVALALLFRLPRLVESPGWDGDEGYNLNIAWHLLHGRAQMFALSYAFVQHPVLFYALLAPLLGVFGQELWVLRAVTALSGSLVAGLLYLAGAAAGGRRTAVLAALAFAGAFFTGAYNRLGYTYNLLLLWSALALFLVIIWERTRRPGWLWSAATAAALGLLTDQVGIFLPLFVAIRAWPHRRTIAAVLAVGVLPAAIAAAIVVAWQPDVALADWRHTLARAAASGAGIAAPAGPAVIATALARWLANYFHLLRAEWWWPAAVAGLVCVQPLDARRRLLALAGLMVAPIFALRELEPFFRTGVPLLLPAAWGLGALMNAGITAVYQTIGATGTRKRLLAAAATAFVVLLPLGFEIGRSAGGLLAGFSMRIDWVLASDHGHARAAAAFVNERTDASDVVLVSPHVSWLYHARVADFFQAITARGEAIAFYPAGLPARRFRFDPSTATARYAVLDRYWDLWAAESESVARLVAEIETWPLEWRGGDYRVYRRPDALPA
ncbi:MAG: ArnT family glycosyltransferase [Chloroflexota bacterium]